MLLPRIIPCLLLKNQGLVKTIQFQNERYIGDPLNAVKIFNDKEIDELIFLDITATREKKLPPFQLLASIAGECFMPLTYGGGIKSLDEIKKILGLGIEKIALNTAAIENPQLVSEASQCIGSQSIVISLDVKQNRHGQYEVHIRGGQQNTGLDPTSVAIKMQALGAGEILLNSIDRDGTLRGYDLGLVKRVATAVDLPVIACGGAGNLNDLTQAIKLAGASAAAAASLFLFVGPHRAVLINYPSSSELKQIFG